MQAEKLLNYDTDTALESRLRGHLNQYCLDTLVKAWIEIPIEHQEIQAGGREDQGGLPGEGDHKGFFSKAVDLGPA